MSDYAKQPRRKFCQFCKEDTQYIDYKDIWAVCSIGRQFTAPHFINSF